MVVGVAIEVGGGRESEVVVLVVEVKVLVVVLVVEVVDVINHLYDAVCR